MEELSISSVHKLPGAAKERVPGDALCGRGPWKNGRVFVGHRDSANDTLKVGFASECARDLESVWLWSSVQEYLSESGRARPDGTDWSKWVG